MPASKVHIAVLGVGGVGKCFLSQLEGLARRQPNPPLILDYIATSTRALYNDDSIPVGAMPPDDLSAALASPDARPALAMPALVERLAAAASSSPSPPSSQSPARSVLVDNTSSQAVADAYPAFLSRGVSIVTPNKKAFSGPYALWRDIEAAAAQPGAGRVYHESSCGAGLPVISTLKDLVRTGDEIVRIEGVFSGTMSFLFNSFAPAAGPGPSGLPPPRWSAAVARAKELGYTEPDPRDDLNGLDVARKLTILARLAGLPVESANTFPVMSLIPRELEAASGDEFMARLPDFDLRMDEVRTAAAAEGEVVRFVGSIVMATKQVRVGLERFETTHPIAALKGSDNIISFYTKRYGSNPLIIQGAGAGGEVTAMGVMSDLLKVLDRDG